VRRILTLAGWRPVIGLPGPGDAVGVWGASPIAWRGEVLARATGAPLLRIEDAFLRSVLPGRAGGAPIGLMIDDLGGVHFDPAAPSRIETILSQDPLDDPALLARARAAMARLAAGQISKYTLHDPGAALPKPGYALVIDQTRGDGSVRACGADAARFGAMLAAAEAEHPGAPVLIRRHPETALGLRPGHFGPEVLTGRTRLAPDGCSPRRLLEGARAVYTVSSQMGFEAILAGHRPQVFGRPFYAGWGLSEDRDPAPLPRRGRALTPEALFAGAMIRAPVWFDPCRDRLCTLEEAIDQIEAEARAHAEDRAGHVGVGMRLWKRGHLNRVFGRSRRMVFAANAAAAVARARATGRAVAVWGAGADPALAAPGIVVRRIEDGFLRSRGLGAELVPPLSLVADPVGIYYDPTRESGLERLLEAPLPPGGHDRAARLIVRLRETGVGKYNLPGASPDLSRLGARRRILVPGQVEDDASVRLGCSGVATNLGLLRVVRAANPDAAILWKPHPDIEAGLRPGAVHASDLAGLADAVLDGVSAAAAIAAADEVWTMTSTLGFEALIRGLPVTCLGVPFYAGWGLTRDLGGSPAQRRARPDLETLVHAALVAYPRYADPVSGLPCPVEVALDRLASGAPLPGPPALRLLARVQGWAMGAVGPVWR
jgi:capsular polysaccharide export protein